MALGPPCGSRTSLAKSFNQIAAPTAPSAASASTCLWSDQWTGHFGGEFQAMVTTRACGGPHAVKKEALRRPALPISKCFQPNSPTPSASRCARFSVERRRQIAHPLRPAANPH